MSDARRTPEHRFSTLALVGFTFHWKWTIRKLSFMCPRQMEAWREVNLKVLSKEPSGSSSDDGGFLREGAEVEGAGDSGHTLPVRNSRSVFHAQSRITLYTLDACSGDASLAVFLVTFLTPSLICTRTASFCFMYYDALVWLCFCLTINY